MQTNGVEAKAFIDNLLNKNGIVILPPLEAKTSIRLLNYLGYRPNMTMLDPWYNRGTGGVREDYVPYILEIINGISSNTDHFFLWGFPEIVAQFINRIPEPLEFICWLTWYYKNNPSVIRGWRSSQQACLHYAVKDSKMYPEHFFNGQQELRFESGKMRFVPGPTSVIEEPLLVGFIGKKEQTGHPSQKPEKVYERLLLMTTKRGDLVYDPMSGSGTTAVVSKLHHRKCIISDLSEEYTKIAEERTGITRVPVDIIENVIERQETIY